MILRVRRLIDGKAETPALRAWMKLVMYCLQPLLIDMRVNLRGRDIGVTQHFLDDAQVGAVA